MDSYSCGEDLFLKARKPYTITKQRERWTEEEHNRFLEALKLHGRAWQRIEEHIGTKTAVQIRSHAQKFFSKLEKEAVVKGVSLGQTLEIEIPPPRPKRKPSYPYPRKSYRASSITSSVPVTDGKLLTLTSSLYPGSEISELKNDPSSQNPGGTENSAREKETLDEENCLEDNLFQEASCVSVPSASQSSISTSMVLQKICTFREFVPSRKDIIESKDHIGKGDYPKLDTKDVLKSDRTEANLSHVDINGTGEMLSLKNSCHSSQDKLVRGNNTDKLKKPENVGQLSTADEIQANHSYPRHVPVHIVNMSSGACVQPRPPGVYPTPNICHLGSHGNPYIFPNLTVSAATQPNSNITSRSSLHHQTLPNFPPPFAPLHNQETQKSAQNISSAFGGLLMSALLQNPAAHTASLAASFWPTPNGETSLDSSAGPLGGFLSEQMSATPNLAAIAAATVAAASAWWAAHGMLPLCPPMHTGFSYPQPQPTTATPMDITHAPLVDNNERQDNSTNNSPWEAEQIDPEVSEATKPQNRTSKWQTLSSSDSAESGGGSQSNCNKPKSAGEEQNPDTTTELVHDSNKSKMRKKVDRSSCGSNTASSTEVETDALEQDEEEPEQDQAEKEREESKEADSNHQVGEHNRRSRSSTSNTNGNTSANTNGSTSTNTNTNESWKEVSEEGRIAFQALFTRQVLPQSFSPPPDPKIIVQQQQQQQQPAENIVMEELKQISDVKDDDDEQMLQLNLSSSNSWGVNPEHSSLLDNNVTESSFLSMGLGHGKFKARRTGFKPYKRCSVEAKESRITGGSGQCCEEKGPKRIRLEGDASTL
ncbi:protein LHY-like isoform X1 [Papaver somniferum]|uniref:protein LHY-like isoform X1 n=1 Tax=Papaver somniferum TaxID=3469 RepID=UPI000E705AB3|nr:protein LHY-like isoform X1 [Papaver somniferum]XP_026401964.1 protein LHY-like isoform X1 [Papaver somniferum]XP_026401965.1 protein LHY-like isoform X1 [Papaver somniferum]XP_026401966.1 protein LHY-like isoform X1 [Papaver somniferum]